MDTIKLKIPSSISSRSWLDIAIRSTAVFLVYGLVVYISSLYTFEPSSTPLFWPANAIGLVIMLYAARARAMIYLVAIFLSYFMYLYFHDVFGFWPSCLLTSANIIEILAGYYLIKTFVSKPLRFDHLKNTMELILYGVILNSVVGATAGTLLMYSIWEAPTLVNWSIWFGTAAIGNLMVLPLLISWLSSKTRKYSSKEIVEMIALFTFCFVGSIFLFNTNRDTTFVYPYLIFPLLLWSGIRFDQRVTSIAFLIFLFISAVCSSMGMGPFAMGEFYRGILLIRFHLFCGITIMTVLFVSALSSEREHFIKELQDAMGEIKTLKGFIPICSHCKKIRDDSGYWTKLETYIHENSDAQLSHGICPSCMKKYYGKYYRGSERNDGVSSL